MHLNRFSTQINSLDSESTKRVEEIDETKAVTPLIEVNLTKQFEQNIKNKCANKSPRFHCFSFYLFVAIDGQLTM